MALQDVQQWTTQHSSIQGSTVQPNLNKDDNILLTGKFNGEKDTEYNIEITDLTEGVVYYMNFEPAVNPSGLTNGTYQNLATTNVASAGSGLVISLEVKTGSVNPTSGNNGIVNSGSGYEVGDTVKVAGNLIGGATPADDITLTIGAINNTNMKYRVGTIIENLHQGFSAEITPSVNIPDDIGHGLSLTFQDFVKFTKGEKIIFSALANGAVTSDMFVLKTKDGSHLIKYWNGALDVDYNIHSKQTVDENNNPTEDTQKSRVGYLARSSRKADFAQINSKSISVGLGGARNTPPKWVGMPQHKQFNKELEENTIIIDDAELKVPKDVPPMSDMVKLDVANWYDANDNKGGPSGAWTQVYFAGFVIGSPDLFVFRTHTDSFNPTKIYQVKEFTRYGIEDTNLQRPLSISTDGPHLFVLDDVGSGLVHCYKFIGGNDSNDSDSPTIAEFKKYNSNWPYALPDSPAGICINRNKVDVPCAGAWYSDIVVTPQDSRFNTSSGGNGRIFIQASWEFNKDNDYADYVGEDGVTDSQAHWSPPIMGHTANMEWLWSITLANPAHPTGMIPTVNNKGRLFLENRSPALDKFYKINNHVNLGFKSVIRGDYDITEGGHPQAATPDASNPNSTNFFETDTYWLANGADQLGDKIGLAKKIGIEEAGILQLFRFGLTDIGEATKVGVSLVYSSSDTTRSQWAENLKRIHSHKGFRSMLYAEIISSSAFYHDSFALYNVTSNASDEINNGKTRDRRLLDGNNKPKEVELAALPASQVVTFNIIDGASDGFSKKPLIIPLNTDALIGGYNQSAENLSTYNAGDYGAPNITTESSRSLVGDNGKPSLVEKIAYTRTSNVAYLVITTEDGSIYTHNIETLRAHESYQTGTGANSWNKETFFYKNPYHKELDNFISTNHAGKSASEHMPGAFASDGTSTGFVQHPRINGMYFALNDGTDGAEVAYRDKTTRNSNRYTDVAAVNYSNFTSNHNADEWDEWDKAYGGKNGRIRIFTLPHNKSVDFETNIKYDSNEKDRMWDFTPTSAIIGSRLFVINQKIGSWSYVAVTNLDAGIEPATSDKGFLSSDLSLLITGFDDVGNGSAQNNDDRISSPIAAGTSEFVGPFKKDTPADGSTLVDSDANIDYVYYCFNLIYDGYQESPLSDAIGSSVDTNSGWSVQTTGDCLGVQIVVPDIRAISKRVSHINIYRSKNKEDVAFPKAFFQLVEQVALDDVRWTKDSVDDNKWTCSITDKGKSGETFETRTGVSELLDNTMPHYGLSTEGEGYLFITQAWHQTVDKNPNYIFRSKPGKYSVFDWSTDFVELPEYPTAISYYNGKLFAFSESTTYLINPRNMVIEETFLQSGCLSNDAVVSSDYGMFWADSKSIWLYQGSSIQNVGLPIEQGLTASYRNRHRLPYSVHVEFDALTKCFCVFHKPKREYNDINAADESMNDAQLTESSHQAAVWAFHIEKKRWDYWLLNTESNPLGSQTLSVCRDWEGGILYMNKNGLFRLGASEYRKNWQWISKNFVMGFPTLDKRFYKIRAVSQNGTPVIEYKVNDAAVGLGVAVDEKITTKKGKRIKLSVTGNGETAVDSLGIIYRKPKAK